MKELNKECYNNLSKLNKSFNITINALKLNVHNTLEHELAKFYLAWEQLKLNKSIVVEAIFTNGLRADIFVLDDDLALEVVTSESKESIANKRKSYPCDLISLKSEDIIRYWRSKNVNNQ